MLRNNKSVSHNGGCRKPNNTNITQRKSISNKLNGFKKKSMIDHMIKGKIYKREVEKMDGEMEMERIKNNFILSELFLQA